MTIDSPAVRSKRLGIVVCAALIVAAVGVHNSWPDSGTVAPFTVVGGGVAYESAVYRTLAEQGDSGSMLLLGLLHRRGYIQRGNTPADIVEAHMWINLATSRATAENYESFSFERDKTAGLMTPQQIVAAQRRARRWAADFEQRPK